MVGEEVIGTRGRSNCENSIQLADGERWRYRERHASPYKQEHEDLIASIRAGQPINEAQTIAEATLTGIIGREAVYSGKPVEWDAALNSRKRLGPDSYELGPYPIPPIAMPGSYQLT